MLWRYDQRLVEAVVFSAMQRAEAAGQEDVVRCYRRRMDVAYEVTDTAAREQAFFEAHWQLFHEGDYPQLLEVLTQAFPYLQQQVREGVVKGTVSFREEWTDLFVRDDGRRTVLLRMMPERFLERAGFEAFLRHELTYIEDMLDPDFAYQKDTAVLQGDAVATRLNRERYRLLWTMNIDGRSARSGVQPMNSREAHAAALRQAFRGLDGSEVEAHCAQLWSGARPTHPELVALARASRPTASSYLGQQCPVCQFPSHDWVAVDTLPSSAREMIQREFPAWDVADGLCGRCAEVYTVQHAH